LSGSREVARARARYENAKGFARLHAAKNLSPFIDVEFALTSLSLRALEALDEQWPSDERHSVGGGWDWREIRHRNRNDFSTLDIAIWGNGDQLWGLGWSRVTNSYVVVDYVEGDPRSTCPLRGHRILIILEAAALYAQKLGRRELRLHLVNINLKTLIESVYNFSLVDIRGGHPYYKKEI